MHTSFTPSVLPPSVADASHDLLVRCTRLLKLLVSSGLRSLRYSFIFSLIHKFQSQMLVPSLLSCQAKLGINQITAWYLHGCTKGVWWLGWTASFTFLLNLNNLHACLYAHEPAAHNYLLHSSFETIPGILQRKERKRKEQSRPKHFQINVKTK